MNDRAIDGLRPDDPGDPLAQDRRRRPRTSTRLAVRTDPRILVIDDNPAIHHDFRRVLAPSSAAERELAAFEESLFGLPAKPTGAPALSFAIDTALQGKDGLELVKRALELGDPYAVAFVDMRMPPGWDGVETIQHLWEVDPELQVVICSAYSDYRWSYLRERLGERDGLLIVKKPFDPIEIVQAAHALATKWRLGRAARSQMAELEDRVRARTLDLQNANTVLADQMVERERMEGELRLTHKLEAVGRLAAGVAHEINTPVQYVRDTAMFVQEAVTDIMSMLQRHRDVSEDVVGERPAMAHAMEALAAEAELELEFVQASLPGSLARMIEGLGRIASIVRSLRAFAHPDQHLEAAVELRDVIEDVLAVARNEYRYVAEVETRFAELAPVKCCPGEISQVVLNLVINAAHAIQEVVAGSEQRGTITITTRQDGDIAEIAIADTGSGIPESVRDKIFDPFFTTKGVGQGTGQGLAIARAVIESHRGTLTFDTALGAGTMFRIRIPIAGRGTPSVAMAALRR